jgi:hypothetical protein
MPVRDSGRPRKYGTESGDVRVGAYATLAVMGGNPAGREPFDETENSKLTFSGYPASRLVTVYVKLA